MRPQWAAMVVMMAVRGWTSRGALRAPSGESRETRTETIETACLWQRMALLGGGSFRVAQTPRPQTPPGVTGVEAPSMWIRQTTNFGCGNVVSGVWLAGRAHAKLAAGGVDVLASRVSNRGGDSGAFEDLYESGDRSPRRRFV